MAKQLRDAVGRLMEIRRGVVNADGLKAIGNDLFEAIDAVIAAAVAEEFTRDQTAQQIAARVSERQERELVARYGPTNFSREHIALALIAEEIEEML